MLDVGAGTGLVTVPLARTGASTTGIDLSEGMLQRLGAKALEEGMSIPLAVADATALPFADDAFDGLVMRHVLHLIHDWRGVLTEAVRVLQPGGTFLVSITDYTGLYHTLQERLLAAAGDLPIAVGLRPDDPESLERAMAPQTERPVTCFPRSVGAGRSRSRRSCGTWSGASTRGPGLHPRPRAGVRSARSTAGPAAISVVWTDPSSPSSRSSGARSASLSERRRRNLLLRVDERDGCGRADQRTVL